MMFFGAFTLLVLPLFMLVCVQMIKNSSFADSFFGKLLIVMFYVTAAIALATAVYLFTII